MLLAVVILVTFCTLVCKGAIWIIAAPFLIEVSACPWSETWNVGTALWCLVASLGAKKGCSDLDDDWRGACCVSVFARACGSLCAWGQLVAQWPTFLQVQHVKVDAGCWLIGTIKCLALSSVSWKSHLATSLLAMRVRKLQSYKNHEVKLYNVAMCIISAW